jgi:hypothetical protein
MYAPIVESSLIEYGLSTFEQNILKVLLYFNIFDHPLTAREVYSFLPSNSVTVADVARALESDSLQVFVKSRHGYFFLNSAPDACTEERRQKELLARKRIRTAVAVARFIRMFPFVRAVMLSGELSKGVASENSDIDFVIVTKARRLWICRSLLILFKKVFLLNSRKNFCLNHFIAEDYLEVELRNIYSATELATLKPLADPERYADYMRANIWIKKFFPNWSMETVEVGDARNPLKAVQRFFEVLIPVPFGDRLDAWLLTQWQRLWQKRYSYLTEEERNHKFRSDRSISTAYGVDFQEKVLGQYGKQLQQYGLSTPEHRN